MEVYRIEEVSFRYPNQGKNVIEQISLQVSAGEFITICGMSGSGKTTLLKHLKPILTPHGTKKGAIYYFGSPLATIDERKQASEIGYVFQHPDNQIVTDKVWHELAFGLESLGYSQQTIRLRVAEMASYFGIQSWFHSKVSELSGGQKQMLNLAAIMVMQPSVLLLDEPTSQLDPIAAREFLETLKRINQDLGITIILSEHRLEEVIPISQRVIVMDQGKIIADGLPREIAQQLWTLNHPMFFALPSAMQICQKVDKASSLPLTICEGRQWLLSVVEEKQLREKLFVKKNANKAEKTIVELKEVWFRYEKHLPDVIKDLSLEIQEGKFYCILGGNGTGKTTALSLINGVNLPYRGKILIDGRDLHKLSHKQRFSSNLALLPQNPQHLFVKKTVALDLTEMLGNRKLDSHLKEEMLREVVRLTGLEELLSHHPYDLSGGEQQRAALAKILLMEPKILLLDEPTKGLDAFFKEKLAAILRQLTNKKVTIVMVSHDIEFCAKYADTCALFFDGSIVSVNETREFFAGNNFYTTAANRIARHIFPAAITVEDVIQLCQRKKKPLPEITVH